MATSPSNATIHVSAEKFVAENVAVEKHATVDSSDTSYGSNSSVESYHELKDNSDKNFDVETLISDLCDMASKDKEKRTRRETNEERPSTSSRKELSTDAIRQCMDHQFEQARKDELDELI